MTKFTDPEFVRFLIAGGLNTLLGYILYCALLLAMPYGAAYTISYVAGIAISYVLNTFFVFRSRPSVKTAIRFPLVYVAQYILGIVLLTIFVGSLHFDPRIAALAVVLFSLPVTFILSRIALKQSSREVRQTEA